MGKSKTRIFRKGINDKLTTLSRESAVNEVAKLLNNGDSVEAKNLITLFGLYAEEVLEAGASYESVVAIKNIFSK